MVWISVFLAVAVLLIEIASGNGELDIHVNVDKALTTVNDKYLSFGIDSGGLGGGTSQIRWRNSNKYMALTSALAPAILRIGGSGTQRIMFWPEECDSPCDSTCYADLREKFGYPSSMKIPVLLCAARFEAMHTLATDLGMRLFYQVSPMMRTSSDEYNPANFEVLLSYAQERNLSMDFAFANEPHAMDYEISAERLGKDMDIFAAAISKYPLFKDSLFIIGDDNKASYTETQISVASSTFDAVSIHTYPNYGHWNVDFNPFLEVFRYNSFADAIRYMQNITKSMGKGDLPIWITETAPTAGYGGQSFASGFYFVDMLGSGAINNLQLLVRQGVAGGTYALMSDGEYFPFPDYWTAYLYQRLVSPVVLELSVNTGDDLVRLYAHCAKGSTGVVVFGINVTPNTYNGTISSKPLVIKQYALTAPDGDLVSTSIKLNGKVLEMLSDTEFPSTEPLVYQSSTIELQPYSYGFFVIPDYSAPACL